MKKYILSITITMLLSVAATNLFAGKEVTKVMGLYLDKKKMLVETEKVLNRLRVTVGSYDQMMSFLSGGQRHAVAIGRAVCGLKSPDILLLDEPTAGLGVGESANLLELIKNLQEE